MSALTSLIHLSTVNWIDMFFVAVSEEEPFISHAVYVDEVSCGQKRSFQSVPKGSQEVDLLNRRGAP